MLISRKRRRSINVISENSDKELKDELKKVKDNCKDIDKKTHLKNEFEIQKFDYIPIDISQLKNKPKAERKHRKKKTEK